MAATDVVAEPRGERLTREVAHRVFAAEYQAATLEFKEGGERAPSFVVTPLGARINRLLVVGVLTSNEPVGASGEVHRAQVTDPTGIVNVYAGQYQPEAAAALAEMRPPTLVAVIGKSRTYQPEPGVVYTSVRPETVVTVEGSDREAWILETARHTILRLDCMREAMGMQNPTAAALADLGYAPELADGVVRALAHYGPADLPKWAAMVRDALETLLPGGGPSGAVGFAPASALAAAPAPATAPAAAPAPPDEAQEHVDEEVLALVGEHDDGKGAPWEDVLAAAAKKRIGEADVEEALNRLMDKGLVYEPVLGRLKKT